MIADILITLTALIVLTIATYTDIRTTEIPDWLSYSFIFVAFSIRLMYSSLYSDWDYLAFGLIGFALMSVIGNIMYYSKQWGGGDAKLLMGLGISFGTTPSFVDAGIPFLAIIFISIIFVGAIYGVGWAIYLSVKNKNKIAKEIKEIKKLEEIKNVKKISLFASALFLIGFIFIQDTSIRFLSITLLILSQFYSYSWIYMRAIEKISLHIKIPASKLRPGDILLDKKLMKKFNIPEIGIEKRHIEKIQKSKIRRVEIKEGIPFVPSIWIGVIASFFISNLFTMFF